MPIKRADMLYKDYKWNARAEKDDPRVTGEPDHTLLDRNEGYEVLYFLNKCGEKWDWPPNASIASYHKMEKLIREYLPGNIRSQANIKQWIEQNWKNYA